MILGLVSMIVANAASLLGAHAITRKARIGKPHLDCVFFLLVRLALISATVLAAGVSQLLTPLALGVFGLLVLLGPLLLGAYRDMVRPKCPDMGPLLVTLLIIVALRLLLQVWFFAPHNYDALSYHLTKVAEWIRAGGFTREMGVDTHAPFPAGFELLETWWIVFLHHDVLIEMAGVECLILAFAGCYALARELNLSERWASFAAVTYMMTPGLHLSATSCLNDVSVAALVVTTMAFVLGQSPWSWMALAIGFGMGTKPTYAYALPGVVLLAFLLRRIPKTPEPSRRLAWGVALLGFALGAFWYVRNAVWYGNPIHPVGAKGLVASTGELKIQFGPSPSSALKNVLDLLQSRVYDDFMAYGPLLNHISGWGALAFACGLLALILVLRADDHGHVRKVALAFGVSLASVLLLVNHDPWYMRFVLFFPALLSIATAKLIETCRPTLAIAGTALFFQFLATFVPADLQWKNVSALARQSWRERSAATLVGGVPPSDSVAYFIIEPIHNRGESYFLYGPDYSHRVVYLRGSTAQQIREELERGKARVLYRSKETDAKAPLFQDCLRGGFLKPLDGRFYEVVAHE